MSQEVEWITSREAARRLGVKLETLYAYASRGLVESVPGVDGRGRRYSGSSIERLKTRHDARAGHGAVAASALRWGEPSLETAISEIRADGPSYRGESALALCGDALSFESVAELLWSGALGPRAWSEPPLPLAAPALPRTASPSAYLAAAVSIAGLADDARHTASEADERARARRLVLWLATIVGGAAPVREGGGVAERLLASFGRKPRPKAVRLLDRALILCAEHELNASTFAARVTASTGADVYACLGAALHAHSGPRHGGASARVTALLREITRPARAGAVVRARLSRGEGIPGFGHPLYPSGDPRGRALLALAREARSEDPRRARIEALCTAMARAGQPGPNLDAGLVAVCRTLTLPESSAAAVFAVGRSAGWIAHALEQRAQGYLLRPRARYRPPA